MSFCLAYMTFGSLEEARNIGKNLLEKKIVACLNIFPQIESHYVWKEELCSEVEIVVLAKLQEKLFPDLQELVLSSHSYENPCLIKIPITGGSLKFLNWIKQGE